MGSPRVRFTVRRLMVAVAVVAILCGASVLVRRSSYFRAKAVRYRVRVGMERSLLSMLMMRYDSSEPEWAGPRRRRISRLQELMRKYDRAARYPWLPVAPDPE